MSRWRFFVGRHFEQEGVALWLNLKIKRGGITALGRGDIIGRVANKQDTGQC